MFQAPFSLNGLSKSEDNLPTGQCNWTNLSYGLEVPFLKLNTRITIKNNIQRIKYE